MRPLLVGELNPHSARRDRALAPLPRGAAGDRLRKVLGMTDREYLRAFVRTNLCWRRWSRRQARREATVIARTWPGPVVLLGQKVAAAFGLEYRPLTRDGRFLVVPHPSGRCRAWNDPTVGNAVRQLVRGMIAE